MVVDFVRNADEAGEAIRRAAEIGAIPFPAPRAIDLINALPRFPERPYRENGESIVSFPAVRNFMILSDSRPFGRARSAARTNSPSKCTTPISTP